jgi:cellulose biosynthesis protein BcsQ
MVAKAENDMRLNEFQGLTNGVGQLDDYDIVLCDTSPDYLKRPYLAHILMTGGYAVLPAPAGRRERLGVGNMLDHIHAHIADRMDVCFLMFMEPERGVTVKIKDVIPNFARRYPQVKVLGTLPRSPRLASLADEHDGYLSMLDIAPQAPFARALNQMADSLCKQIGIPMSLAMPKANPFRVFVAKLRGDKVNVPPANTSVGALQA